MVGTSRTAVVNVKEIEYGTWICSSAKPKSSADVVMKKNEKADTMAKKRIINAIADAKGVPKITFIINMNRPRKSPPRIDRNQRLILFAKMTSGTWVKKVIRRT